MAKQGEIEDCISFYQRDLYTINTNNDLSQYNNEFFNLEEFELIDADGEKITGPASNDKKHYVRIGFTMKKLHSAFTIGYAVYDSMGRVVCWTNAVDKYDDYKEVHLGKNIIEGEIPEHFLNEGVYTIRLMTGIHYQEWLVNPDMNCPTKEFIIQGGLSNSPFWMIKRSGICAPLLTWKQIK